MDNFTTVSAMVGGLLIGLAAALLSLTNSRIAGISGIAGNVASTHPGDIDRRITFVAGLVAAPLVCATVAGMPVVRIDASAPVVLIGGLLVGFDTRLGGGCTSDHGVCGLARFSPRLLVTTCPLMAAGL
jgi:uncharacterized membrane protein YedE/YeeE